MSNIFVSYAREDRVHAELLAEKLTEEGFSLWWDRKIPPGFTFDEVVGKELNEASCVIVLWSALSVDSHWVREEASRGLAHSRLIPVMVEQVSPPLGFGQIEAAELWAWDGSRDNVEFRALVDSLKRILEMDDGEIELDLVPVTPEAEVPLPGVPVQESPGAPEVPSDEHEGHAAPEPTAKADPAPKPHSSPPSPPPNPRRKPEPASPWRMWVGGAVVVAVVGGGWMVMKASGASTGGTSDPNVDTPSPAQPSGQTAPNVQREANVRTAQSQWAVIASLKGQIPVRRELDSIRALQGRFNDADIPAVREASSRRTVLQGVIDGQVTLASPDDFKTCSTANVSSCTESSTFRRGERVYVWLTAPDPPRAEPLSLIWIEPDGTQTPALAAVTTGSRNRYFTYKNLQTVGAHTVRLENQEGHLIGVRSFTVR